MRRIWLAILLGGLVAGGWWARGSLFPGEAVRLRRAIETLAAEVSFDGREGNLAAVSRISAVVDRFAPDASVQVEILGSGVVSLNGRDEIQQALFAARRLTGRLSVKFFDIAVDVAEDGQTAQAHLTASAEAAGDRRHSGGSDAVELKFRLRKLEERWKIQQVETVPTLKQ